MGRTNGGEIDTSSVFAGTQSGPTLVLSASSSREPARGKDGTHGSKDLPDHRPGGAGSWSVRQAGCAQTVPGSPLDAVGRSAPELSHRGSRLEGLVAGGGTARHLEARPRRGVFIAGSRERRGVRHVRPAAPGGRPCGGRGDGNGALGTRDAHD